MIGVCIDAGAAPYLVMPYMLNGSLLSYLRKERPKLTIVEGAMDDLVRQLTVVPIIESIIKILCEGRLNAQPRSTAIASRT